MYLDGQLPYGPKSDNPGAPVIPTLDSPGVQNTYLVPDGGDTVVSPTVANVDGIVQYPQTTLRTSQFDPLRRSTASYGQCGDYGANGSLTTIAKGIGRGLGALCQSGVQTYIENTVPEPSSGAGIAIAVGALAAAILLSRSDRR